MNVQLDSVGALVQLLVVLFCAWYLLWYAKDTYMIERKEKAEHTLRLFNEDM